MNAVNCSNTEPWSPMDTHKEENGLCYLWQLWKGWKSKKQSEFSNSQAQESRRSITTRKKNVCFQIHMMITSLNTPRIPLIYKYSLTFYFPSSLFSIFLSYFLLLLYLGQHIDKMALVKNGTRKKSLKLTYSSKYRGENIIKSKKKVWL